MQIRIIAVGKIKERYIAEGIAEYEKRLRPYVKTEIIEIADEKRPVSSSPATESAALEKEGHRILGVIPGGAYVIALEITGKALASEELAVTLKDLEIAGRGTAVFIVGGDLGLSPSVLARSDLRLSLSKMTFTHPMARLLLVEQVYRACRINSGEPYHK